MYKYNNNKNSLTSKWKLWIAQCPPYQQQQQQQKDQYKSKTPGNCRNLVPKSLHPLGKFCRCKEQYRSIWGRCTIIEGIQKTDNRSIPNLTNDR